MKIKAMVCGACGEEYSATVRAKWGVDGLGDGYGPSPKCVALVNCDASVPLAVDKIGRAHV